MGGIGTQDHGYIITKTKIGIITVPMSFGVISTANGLFGMQILKLGQPLSKPNRFP